MDPEEEGEWSELGLWGPSKLTADISIQPWVHGGSPRAAHPPSLLFFQGMQEEDNKQAIQVGFTPQLASHLEVNQTLREELEHASSQEINRPSANHRSLRLSPFM